MFTGHGRATQIAAGMALMLTLVVAIAVIATPWGRHVARNTHVAYFDNTNGLYTGDEIRILGVAVGTVDKVEPQPNSAKVTFSVDSHYQVPADVKAAIRRSDAGRRGEHPDRAHRVADRMGLSAP
ncbi:MlaD family protein [Mycolicibacterium sarraceniae]|uniref:Mce/MlaD domain-containing protein n=1 Tax=Mycolicibacterium sarraceniae TaxID=1534348 RepID=A0A7I7SL87_9MYCO|nr:MlaD family protein [Mycolicibacterium sarraceniae]BBY57764.1 hypothetical protein MSAR_09000 [Mycolicibacterium sarraceniae]